MLGVRDVDENELIQILLMPGNFQLVKQLVHSYFDSAASFAMIRGGHVDVAILGVLQVDERQELQTGPYQEKILSVSAVQWIY